MASATAQAPAKGKGGEKNGAAEAPEAKGGESTAIAPAEKHGLAEANVTNREKIRGLFSTSEAKIAALVPKHVSPERLVKVALAAIFRTPKLLECNPVSLLNAFMECSQLGLECGGVLGQAYLVPYNNKVKREGQPDRWETSAQFILGYRGMIALARRSGEIASIEANVVREGDVFEEEKGSNPRLRHVPNRDTAEVRPLRLVYAIARLTSGETVTEVMSKAEVDKIRARSKSRDNGPWVSDYDEMARKTVVRRLFKYLPVSIEVQSAVNEDDERDRANETIDVLPQIEGESRAAQLARRIAESNQAPAEIDGEVVGRDGGDGAEADKQPVLPPSQSQTDPDGLPLFE